MAAGGTTAPVELVDCAVATRWSAVFDERQSHQDWRFITPDGYYLGLDRLTEALGTEVLVKEVPSSLHNQEWLLASIPEQAVSPPADPAPRADPVAQPRLPQTGIGIAVVAAAGIAAVAAGAVLTLWWRRRVIRTQW
nr:LPXTG cell wall anchor domain-containing protein [Glycomyces sp. L485]